MWETERKKTPVHFVVLFIEVSLQVCERSSYNSRKMNAGNNGHLTLDDLRLKCSSYWKRGEA